jgi:hypothetical protein
MTAPVNSGLRIGLSLFPEKREVVTCKRTDLDQLAYELRSQGLTYRAIAKWLGVTLAMTRRRVRRDERTLREAGKLADHLHSSRE